METNSFVSVDLIRGYTETDLLFKSVVYSQKFHDDDALFLGLKYLFGV